jgi:Flp pilus assembly protein TadG
MRSPLVSKRSIAPKRKQKGAVAIVLGLSLVTLFAMGGVVLDLGHLYVAKSELQNAADAAALAGAVRLNETATGITNARDNVIAVAAQNNFNFSTSVTLTEANVEYSSSPSGPWVSYATAFASPTGMTFVRVNTGPQVMDTYLMRVVGPAFNTISTFGLAVAGRFVNNVTPIGVCAIKNAAGASRPKGEVLPTGELAQFGFRRGVSYNIFALGPLGGSSDPYLLNPVDVYPNPCNGTSSSANNTAPFVCNGSSAILTSAPGTAYGNTGLSSGKIEAALNSRFNTFGGSSVCIPAQAPPDVNIRKFACTGGGCSTAADWMDPSQQTITPTGIPTIALPTPAGITSKNQYGVLWSYSRAVNAVGTTPNATPGVAFATSNWSTLYPAPGGAPVADADFPAATSPYLDPDHITAPTVNPGALNRRVLNLAIADCPAVTGSGGCQVIPVLGIGRFFMQVPADFSGSPKKLEVEFAGLISPIPVSEIRLYR